jgi:hypothetical protein
LRRRKRRKITHEDRLDFESISSAPKRRYRLGKYLIIKSAVETATTATGTKGQPVFAALAFYHGEHRSGIAGAEVLTQKPEGNPIPRLAEFAKVSIYENWLY